MSTQSILSNGEAGMNECCRTYGEGIDNDDGGPVAGRSRPRERRHAVSEECAHRPRGGIKEDASFAFRDRERRCEERRREPENRRSCIYVPSRVREQREVLLVHENVRMDWTAYLLRPARVRISSAYPRGRARVGRRWATRSARSRHNQN